MAHFRVHYFALLLLSSMLLIAFKERRQAGVIGGFTLFNLILIFPLFSRAEPVFASLADSVTMRVMSINLLSKNKEIDSVVNAVRSASPDVLVFLEVDAWWQGQLESHLSESYPYSISRPREDNFGITLFSAVPLQDAEILDVGERIPAVFATINHEGQRFDLLGVHLIPPINAERTDSRDDSFKNLGSIVDSLKGEGVVVGDLNATQWSAPFRHLLRETRLHDSTRGFGFQPTWPTFLPGMGIAIDHCLHTDGVSIIDRVVGEDLGSDHYPLIVDLVISRPGNQ